MKDITKEEIFGRVLSYMFVVEFQKRGLPHAHILIVLDEKDKPKTGKDYDDIVSAELPDENETPLTFETIKRFNIHGPCGELNPNSPCMHNGKCEKRYPREFTAYTIEDTNGYPIYRRRNKQKVSVFVKGKSVTVGNEFVVPYNKWLSTKYNAHINVEICSTIKAVKYLYKYVYKGYDNVIHSIRNDEIEYQGYFFLTF